MFKLNLLPPKEIKRLELTKFAFLLIFFGFRLAIVFLIFIVALAATYFSLVILVRGQDNLIEARQSNEKSQYQIEIEDRVQEVNQAARRILVKQNELIVWTPVLEKLSDIVPNGIYLTSFSYNNSINQISITGQANSRDSLLTFENSLKESSYFKDVNAPLSNLIKQTNISFSFTANPARSLERNKEE